MTYELNVKSDHWRSCYTIRLKYASGVEKYRTNRLPKDERVKLFYVDYNEQDIERAKEKIKIGCALYNQLMNQ